MEHIRVCSYTNSKRTRNSGLFYFAWTLLVQGRLSVCKWYFMDFPAVFPPFFFHIVWMQQECYELLSCFIIIVVFTSVSADSVWTPNSEEQNNGVNTLIKHWILKDKTDEIYLWRSPSLKINAAVLAAQQKSWAVAVNGMGGLPQEVSVNHLTAWSPKRRQVAVPISLHFHAPSMDAAASQNALIWKFTWAALLFF